jgi:aryl-alcohol dehydrogenase-like predicted oxidoreductase
MKVSKINRRLFLSKASAGLAGVGAGVLTGSGIESLHDKNGTEVPRIKEYRTLGRTGFKVSDIGCGPAVMTNENLLSAVINSGVNIIDTAEFYGNGNNEILVGKAIKGHDREKLFINTKLRIAETDKQEDIVLKTRKCLERMNTDYLDGMMLWNPSTTEEVKNKAFHRAFEQLKREGRVKFCGISSHGSEFLEMNRENMEQIICGAVEDGRFDLVLFVYNYAQREMGKNILKLCAEKNIGTMLMKTDPLGKGYSEILARVRKAQSENQPIPDNIKKRHDLIIEKQKKAEQFLDENPGFNKVTRREAAVGFCLDNPAVSSVLISFRTFEDINDYVVLSGSKLTSENLSVIETLMDNCGFLYCRHACGKCEPSCPLKVPVNTIMRYNHYFTAQAREKYAIQQYRLLAGANAGSCSSCAGYCEEACPYGVPVKTLLELSHLNLSIDIS